MRKLLLILASFAFGLSLSAQSVYEGYPGYEEIKENPRRAANAHHCYEPVDTLDTPAPAGYKAVYISHIGRHGSRYNWRKGVYDKSIAELQQFSDSSRLTEDGEALLRFLKDQRDLEDGKVGTLTARGALEHRQIAGRMYRRFHDVFAARKAIVCSNTPSGRVIASRDNFVARLKELDPGLTFEYDSPEGSASTKKKLTDEQKEEISANTKAPLKEVSKVGRMVKMDRLMAKTFKNPSEIKLRSGRHHFFQKIYNAAAIRQCFDPDCNLPYIEDYFTTDEIYSFWYQSNAGIFKNWGWSEENRGYNARRVGSILHNIIDEADICLKKGDRAANLRFSHDTYVQPLCSLIGLSGNEYRGSITEANSHYLAFRSVCMASNLQFVFYRNKKKDVLVKILHNEKECVIPSLKKINKVYHKWPELRKYLLDQIGE